MKEPYSEGLASHAGPESCARMRKDAREALTGECVGRVLSREIIKTEAPRLSLWSQSKTGQDDNGEPCQGLPRSETPCMHRSTSRENREIPRPPAVGWLQRAARGSLRT